MKRVFKNIRSAFIGVSLCLILFVVVVLYLVSSLQEGKWESGEIQIRDTTIQLPCSLDDFKNNTGAIVGEADYTIAHASIDLNNNMKLNFQLFVKNNMVTGIIIDTKNNDPAVYHLVKFPENITLLSNEKEIRSAYDIRPLNVGYIYDEGSSGISSYRYTGKNYDIEIRMQNGNIIDIMYDIYET